MRTTGSPHSVRSARGRAGRRARERALTTGTVGWSLLINAAYLTAMGATGMYIASRRLGKLLLE
ncbi:hypothetical protein ACFVWG_21650 [Kribbella sp. NPDC058245]|uniref:hypothetical protein n=1 Tax=Kribbella sp. NPDC058245 TaxID=3346399 RepID=UPI0036EDD848